VGGDHCGVQTAGDERRDAAQLYSPASGLDDGERGGLSSAAAAESRALKRRNAELEQTIDILKAARLSSCGESDPRNRR
jgi:hypothetical protein